jgi:hypothetical protein
MLHEWEPLLAPGAEEESLLSEGGQTTLNAQNQSPDPFPLVLGGRKPSRYTIILFTYQLPKKAPFLKLKSHFLFFCLFFSSRVQLE